MSRARDTQREKLYRSERTLRAQGKAGRRIEDLPDVQAYVDKFLASAWRKRHHPGVRVIRVDDGRGRRRGGAGSSWITLPRWTRDELYICHEVAHIATTRRHLGEGVAHHGWQYAGILLEIVGYQMGRQTMLDLREQFKRNHVRYKKPRELSPETLAAMRERGRLLAAGSRRSIEPPALVEDDRITSFIERLES